MDDFAARLRVLRKDHLGITQTTFAKEVGCNDSYISLLESRKKNNPSQAFLETIRARFGVRIDWLEKGSGKVFESESESYSKARSSMERTGFPPSKDDCLDYLKNFIDREVGDNAARLAWVFVELHDRFPVGKFNKQD